jgi:CRISPR type IV-associated protein Csf3
MALHVMTMYKITFHLTSPISFIDRPIFDGLLAYCYLREKHGSLLQKLSLTTEEMDDFSGLPLVRHPDGWFLASWMLFDEEKATEYTGSWKKRWAAQHDHLVDFGKKVAKVRTTGGPFKAYDQPIVLHSVRKVWFFFASEDVKEVERLLSRHLFGIGKKTSQGYGQFSHFEIEAERLNVFGGKQIIRPIPAREEDLKRLKEGSFNLRMMAWKPPYWLPANMAFCFAG